MDIQTFDSFEQALEWMARMTDEANKHLAPPQRALTFGSHWVRFADVENRIVEFGYVLPLEVIDFEPEDGYPVEVQRQEMIANTERGYLFSRAHSVLSPEGEMGDTHRANAWPIEERLFDMAEAVDWKVDDLDEAGKILLEIAYRSYVIHMRSLT